MRLTALCLTSLLTLACVDPTSGGDTADAGVLSTRVLIHYGHGGVGPEGMWGDMTHDETIAMYRQAGLEVSHTADWATLKDYRAVIFPAPGFKSASARFSSAEVEELRAFMEAGGIAVVEGENSAVLDPACINQLFTGLGFATRLTDGWMDGDMARKLDHPLMAGVTTLGVQAAGRTVVNGESCLASSTDGCAFVAKGYGSGWLLLISDGNSVSDLASWDGASRQNRQLLKNIARLP
jgi:hypothetical protein